MSDPEGRWEPDGKTLAWAADCLDVPKNAGVVLWLREGAERWSSGSTDAKPFDTTPEPVKNGGGFFAYPDRGGAAMSEDLNKTIAELARTTVHGTGELTAIAEAYPDPAFLRFVVGSWSSGVRVSVWQLAEFFYNPELRAEHHPTERSAEWCVRCPNCYPGRVAPPCGKLHDCAECAKQRAMSEPADPKQDRSLDQNAPQ